MTDPAPSGASSTSDPQVPTAADEAAQRAKAANANVVSAKENQPTATPADMSKSNPDRESGADKIADLGPQSPAPTHAVPTQDPPVNVDNRVPPGSSRVDFAPNAAQNLANQPGGHLGAGGNPPTPPVNPPVRERGGATPAPVGSGRAS